MSLARRLQLSRARASLFLLALAVLPCLQAAAEPAVVATVGNPRELHAALADPEILEILLDPGGEWNYTDVSWPGQLTLLRNVSLRGLPDADGGPPYVDVNRLTELVVVGAGGGLHQSDIYADDCLVPVMPLLCFAVGADMGNITLERFTLGDTSCTDISQSTATDWLLKSAFWATWHSSWTKVDDRSIHVEDTGEVVGLPQGVRWRIINSTFRCTGNETHPLPWPGTDSPLATGPSEVPLLAAAMAALVAAVAVVYYAANRNVVTVARNESAEVVVARSKGIVLQALIGTFGRVYRGQFRGQTVAIKVMEFLLYERRAAAEVMKECQHAVACRHPACVTCVTFFTVTVRTQLPHTAALQQAMREGCAVPCALSRGGAQQHRAPQQSRDGAPSMKQQQQELETGADESPASAAGAARAAAGTAESRASSLPEPATAEQGVEPPRPAASAAAASLLGGGGSLLSGGGGSYSTLEGVMTLLVMEYCSLGSLHRAISAGRFFLDRRAQRVNLDWVCRTALDVAEGLQHLHEAHHLVHRDVSTSNILLTPDPSDPRGFRAKLSDFGLSTVLRDRQTHKTSQLKGTVDFMPPEVFTCGEVRFDLDMFGFGIVVYWMCKGEGPFAGLAPFQIVGKKLEAAHRQQRLALPPVPAALGQLLWDCTHWDPAARRPSDADPLECRPTAAQAVRRLRELLSELGQGDDKLLVPRKAASM